MIEADDIRPGDLLYNDSNWNYVILVLAIEQTTPGLGFGTHSIWWTKIADSIWWTKIADGKEEIGYHDVGVCIGPWIVRERTDWTLMKREE